MVPISSSYNFPISSDFLLLFLPLPLPCAKITIPFGLSGTQECLSGLDVNQCSAVNLTISWANTYLRNMIKICFNLEHNVVKGGVAIGLYSKLPLSNAAMTSN